MAHTPSGGVVTVEHGHLTGGKGLDTNVSLGGTMLVLPILLVIGLLAVIIATERYGLRFGGVIVVPVLAVYVLFDYRALPLFVLSTATAFVGVNIVERRVVLFGRKLLITSIVIGALVPVTAFLMAQGASGGGFSGTEVAYLGSILPGIAAYNLHRLDREERVADVIGSLALVVGLALLAGFFVLSRSVVGDAVTVESVLATAIAIVEGRIGVGPAPPVPIIPRETVVGLFVVGLLLNEGFRRRYGFRLAGMIVVPLVAVFTLHDVRLLALFLTVAAVGAAFIRVVHRQTFLYGRNLLAGTCIVGVILGATAQPFLPAGMGIRPLLVGILAGVAAYNGHVLAPSERVQSVAVSAGAFVVLLGLTNGVATVLGRPFARTPDATVLVTALAVLAISAVAIYEGERTRPDGEIRTVVDSGATPVPDGGTDHSRFAVPDGGLSDPLAGRRVSQVGPNARLVYREREAE